MERSKTKSLITLLVFLSMVFPIIGQMGTALAQASGSIAGTVVGVDDKPVVGVEVQLIDIDKGNIVASTKTAKGGSFNFDGLKVGKTYMVKTFHGKDIASIPVTALIGPSQPVALKLSQTKGFIALVGGPAAGAGGLSTAALVGIGAAVAVAGGVGVAAATGAIGDDDEKRPASP